MRTTYAVVWQEGEGPLYSGMLELATTELRLEGGNDTVLKTTVPYADLATVRVGRRPDERLDGRPTLMLERLESDPIRLASVAQPGIVSELAERLLSVYLGATGTSLVVVLPLREDARSRVLSLLASGPPFDPERAGLDRHDVFVTDREVVFFFEAAGGTVALERLLSRPELWRAALSWRNVISGPPRIGELGYSWTKGTESNGVVFSSTPGPGDSDGGDIYSP